MSVKDGESATEFTLGQSWKIFGEGLWDPSSAPEGEWGFEDAMLNTGSAECSMVFACDSDGTCATFAEICGGEISAGTYENATLTCNVTRDGQTEEQHLTIPTLVVE